MEVGQSALDEDNLPEVSDMVSVCAGLVTVDEESKMIRLVHYTTQEYFERTWKQWFPTAEDDITTICCTYLSFDVFSSGSCKDRDDPYDPYPSHSFEGNRQRLLDNPLFEYAARNWAIHAKQTNVACQEAIEFLRRQPQVKAASQILDDMIGSMLEYDYRDNPPLVTGMSGLHLAAYLGVDYAVRILLLEGKATIKTDDDWTPLHYAVLAGHESTVKILLDAPGVEGNIPDNEGRTPLVLAITHGFEAIAQILLTALGTTLHAGHNRGARPLEEAAEGGHLSIVKSLLAIDAVEVDLEDDYGQTPLSLAAAAGHQSVVELLYQTGKCNPDSRVNGDYYKDRTPLSFAAEGGHLAVVRQLLDTGKVNPNSQALGPYYFGHTPLSFAARNGHVAVVKLLLEITYINIDANLSFAHRPAASPADKRYGNAWEQCEQNLAGRTPLSWASEQGWALGQGPVAVVSLLLEKGATVDLADDCGRTPLSWATEKGVAEVVDRLLRSQANVNSRDRDGKTPLFWAIRSWNDITVKRLLESGATVDGKDVYGRTPLSYASGVGDEAIVQMLLNQGADMESRDVHGRTPLSYFGNNPSPIAVLLQHGAQVDSRDDRGRTPLSHAVDHFGSKEGHIVLLLEYGAEIDAVDIDGRSPLSHIIGRGEWANWPTAKLLLDRGANIHLKDNKGQTPLSIMKTSDSTESMLMLDKLQQYIQ